MKRRSIYRDIDEINTVALSPDEECAVDKSAAMLTDDENGELKSVVCE